MTRISERQSLTREEKFVALVHLYVELRLPFDAALEAAEADLFARAAERRRREMRRRNSSERLADLMMVQYEKRRRVFRSQR